MSNKSFNSFFGILLLLFAIIQPPAFVSYTFVAFSVGLALKYEHEQVHDFRLTKNKFYNRFISRILGNLNTPFS